MKQEGTSLKNDIIKGHNINQFSQKGQVKFVQTFDLNSQANDSSARQSTNKRLFQLLE